jgi:hypothetical protein
MSIESRILFPVSRVVFCAVGLIFFLGTLICGILSSFNVARSQAPYFTRVKPSIITEKLTPFGRAEGTPAQQKPPGPFGRALSPVDQLKQKYPGSNVEELAKLLGPESQGEQGAETLSGMIDEAQEMGDSPARYVDNAIAVLSAVNDPKMRARALQLYHKERLREIRDSQAQRLAAAATAWRQATVAGFSFLCFLQVSLLLSLFAIERNTRSPEQSGNLPGSAGSRRMPPTNQRNGDTG